MQEKSDLELTDMFREDAVNVANCWEGEDTMEHIYTQIEIHRETDRYRHRDKHRETKTERQRERGRQTAKHKERKGTQVRFHPGGRMAVTIRLLN